MAKSELLIFYDTVFYDTEEYCTHPTKAAASQSSPIPTPSSRTKQHS